MKNFFIKFGSRFCVKRGTWKNLGLLSIIAYRGNGNLMLTSQEKEGWRERPQANASNAAAAATSGQSRKRNRAISKLQSRPGNFRARRDTACRYARYASYILHISSEWLFFSHSCEYKFLINLWQNASSLTVIRIANI